MTKEMLQIQKQLLKDDIVHETSRLIKDSDMIEKGGMIEVSGWRLKALNDKMMRLDNLDMDIQQMDIDKM